MKRADLVQEAIKHLDCVRFQLYKKYGLVAYHNYLSDRKDIVKRDEVVGLVKLPHVRRLMENYIEELETKLREATSILEDADK